jgi:phosphoribosylformylglycinamidine cyclo-ligase
MNYSKAGVNIDLGNKLKSTIPNIVKNATRPEVLGKIGGFGGLFKLDTSKYKNPVLVSSTDGVGSKLKLAFEYDTHYDAAHDLVNHCVNDILVRLYWNE